MIIKWVQALKKKKEKNRNHQNKLTIPISFVFFKYPQYLEEIFIWIYMKLFAHVCFFLVPPAALWQITTALLFFLNSPPLILYESSLEQPVFEGKTNRINIWTCSLNDLLDCHCCLDLLYWIALYCTKSGFQCWHSNKRQGDVSSRVDFSVSGFIILFALLLFLNVPILFMCVWALASVTVSLPTYGAHLF